MHRTNPFAYPKPITLETLGDLFAHHRDLAGGARMMADPPADPPTDPPADPPSYTPPASQADLDRIVGDRVARERAKYADYDDLKKKAEAHDKAVDDAKSEAEKAVEAARKEGEEKGRQGSDARVITAEAKAALATAHARNPNAAVKLLDLTGLTVGDDGEVNAAALKTKIDALVESDGYLFGDGAPPKKDPPKKDPSQGGGGGDDKPSVARGRELFEEKRGKKTA